MIELSEAEIKKIVYNCKKATYLIEKQQIGKITVREKMELEIHLTGCSICVTFMKQSAAINQMAQKLFNLDRKELQLGGGFKVQLQKRINNKFDNN